MDQENNNTNEYGKITIADEVVAIIAGLATAEVKGVSTMTGSNIAGSITEMLGKKNLSKGVKVEVSEKDTKIDLQIVVEYGVRIPEIAWNIQENVKKAVETMTGLKVIEVNIYVQGIDFEKEAKKEAKKEMEQGDPTPKK